MIILVGFMSITLQGFMVRYAVVATVYKCAFSIE